MTRCSTGRATQKYSSSGGGADLSSVLTAHGDILYADSNTEAANVSIGSTTGHVLTITSPGELGWQAASVSGGNVGTLQAVTDNDSTTDNTVQFLNTTTALTTTGRVGIGTTTPDANLHVNGNAFVSSNLALGGVLSMGIVNVVARHTLSAITATGATTPNTVTFDHPTTAFVTTANVGIGTSTPLQTLEVNGSVGINHNGVGGYTFHTSTGALRAGIHSTGDNHLLFKAGSNNERMRLLAGGALGIGTTTPFKKLTIDGDVHIPSGSDAIAGSFPQNSTTRHLFFGGISRSGSMLQAKTAIVSAPWTQYGGTQSWGRHGLHFCVDSAGDDGNVELGHTKMCINYLGNVGIGSWSTPNPLPQTMASVHGGRVLEGRDATGFEFIAASSDTTNAVGQFNGAFLIKNMDDDPFDSSEPHYIGMAGRGKSTDGSMDLSFYSGRDNYENNTPQMVIDIYSNVGIGTTTPGYTLDVTGDINFTGALTQNGTTYGGGGSGSSQWVTSGNNISYSTGNVGINNTTPDKDLVIGTGAATSAEFSVDVSTPYHMIVGNEFGSDHALDLVSMGSININLDSNDNDTNKVIDFRKDTRTNGGAILMRIKEDGNVGIGTTSPGYDLDVAGDINFTGNVRRRGIVQSLGGSDVSYSTVENAVSTWTGRTLPLNGSWQSVVWSPELSLFVVVGNNYTGRIMRSSDGITWNYITTMDASDWQSVVWSPELSLFVAVADSGTNRVATSPDGITWTARTISLNGWNSVVWSPELSLFAVVSNSGNASLRGATSPDGITWTDRTIGSQTGLGWNGITWSPELSLFVAVADSGINRVATSPDGITWTGRAITATAWRSVVWSPELSLFVAVNDSGNVYDRVATSPDGITWTGRTIVANDWQSVVWSPELSLFVAVADSGTNRVATSPDGITWTGRTIDANDWQSVVWSPELSVFVAVADSGANRVATSNLGIPTPLNTPMAHPGQLVVDTATGNVGIGTAAPVGVNGGQRLEGSSTTGFEFIAASSDTTNIPGQFMGAFLIKNMDATTTAPTPHYVGMAGREGGTTYSGHVDLLFYSGRDNYENNTPQMVIDRYSNVGIGTTTPGAELHVSGTGAIIVPSGSTVDRPSTLVTGMIRYNTTSLKYEGYGMSEWLDLSIADTITQLYTFTSHTFTKAGGDTRYGPQIADTITAYGNITPWNDTALFNVTTRGFQLWTIPKTGTYRIHAKGARGGNKSTSASPNYGNTPGYGGYVYADFALTMNTKIVIIVGQQPPTSTGNYRSGSGGGATWVLKPGAYTNTDDVYLVAGGGGGAGPGHYNSGQAGSADASSQGTLGGGGTSHWNSNGGGAGWTADGAPSGARGGVMPSGGAMGGTGTTHGGFGGGGSEAGDSAAGGAGATGGRAANAYNSTGTNTARGGTSYIQPDTLERISGTTYYKGSSYDNDGSVLVQYIP